MTPKHTLETDIGMLLRAARLKRGVSCRSLATAAGMDHSELSRIERGRVTSLTRLATIAGKLGLDLVIKLKRAA